MRDLYVQILKEDIRDDILNLPDLPTFPIKEENEEEEVVREKDNSREEENSREEDSSKSE